MAERDHTPVITPSGYRERNEGGTPWVFVLWPPPSVATKVLADKIIRDGHKRITVVVSDNTYYRGILAALQVQLQTAGVQVVDVFSFPPGTADYRSALSRISRSESDAILPLLVESGDFAAFLRQRIALKVPLPLYGANTLPFDKEVQRDLSLAEGLVYFDYITHGGADFARKYRERFASEPGFGSAKAYDGVFLIAYTINKCGVERQQIRECLQTIDYQGASGQITFSKDGIIKDTTPHTILFEFRDGKITPLR